MPLEGRRGETSRRIVSLAPGPDAAPYDRLATRLLHHLGRQGWRRLGLVAPQCGAGTTLLAANLAGALARRRDTRAVVIETGSQPGLAALFAAEAVGSTREMLAGRIPFAALARRLGHGTALVPTAPGRRLGGETRPELTPDVVLAGIEAGYAPDLVIFDLPALPTGDGATALLPHLDAALLVAAAGETTVAAIDQAEREVAEETAVLGVVLTKLRTGGVEHG